MTQDPSLSADKVAQLEAKLADAAAQMASVQAELAAARPPYGDQPVDLSAYLTPQVAEQIRSSLSQLGLDGQLGAVLGAPPAAAGDRTSPEHVTPLAAPPRHVPLSYRLATFDLSVYELFLIVILTAAPVAVWVFLPDVVPAALIAAVLVIAAFRIRRYVRRIGTLKWGKVATVAHRDLLDVGTYYGGMTYNNMRKRQATGWDAETIWYSGPAYTNKVDYTLDGVSGSLKYRGLRYTDGVVLADSRDPSKAMTVSQFPYSVKPGPDGRLTGRLTPWLWGGIIATLVIELTIVYLAAYAVLEIWVDR